MSEKNPLIVELFEVRERIKEIKSAELKALEARKKELEEAIFNFLDEAGMDGLKIANVGSVSVTEAIHPNVEDWDAFYEFIKQEDAFYMLNRAPNAASYREALQIGQSIPGVVPFKKRTLSVRAA